MAVYYRERVIPHLPQQVRRLFPQLSHYTPLSTFADQASAGLSSAAFDLEGNIHGDDSRMGLDEHGVEEVQEIMRRERVK